MNKALVVGGLVGGGLLAWWYFMRRPALTGVPQQPFNIFGGGLVQQPGIVYPFQPANPGRTDNVSQPWYGGSRSFNATPDMNIGGLQGLASDIGSVASISKSISSLWDDLNIGDWFSGGDDFSLDSWAENDVQDAMEFPDFDAGFDSSAFNYENVV